MFLVEHSVGKVQPISLQDCTNVFPLLVFAVAHDAVQMEIKSTGIVVNHGLSCFAQSQMKCVFHRHSSTG